MGGVQVPHDEWANQCERGRTETDEENVRELLRSRLREEAARTAGSLALGAQAHLTSGISGERSESAACRG